jgi:AcrR family transcriptional regulator
MKISDLHTSAPDEPDCSDEAVNDPASPCYGNAAGRPRAADKEARQLALLHTATRLFLEKGYSKVSLEMIAREAHVAVRTIYVKFGGKAGLLSAVITEGRARFFADMASMETDPRSLEEILGDFAPRFLELVSMPAFVSLHRMVVAEATTTPELATTFYEAGPLRSREQLWRLFDRPEIRARLRPELSKEVMAVHLINCLLGDIMARTMFPAQKQPTPEELQRDAAQGLDLFLRSVLR